MAEIKRVLVTTDFSERARRGLAYARILGEQTGSAVSAVHVGDGDKVWAVEAECKEVGLRAEAVAAEGSVATTIEATVAAGSGLFARSNAGSGSGGTAIRLSDVGDGDLGSGTVPRLTIIRTK